MKGYIAKYSFDLAKGCSYKYFLNRDEALKWVRERADEMTKRTGESVEKEVSAINVVECANKFCHNLVEEDEGGICLRCEKIQYDLRYDKYEEETKPSEETI